MPRGITDANEGRVGPFPQVGGILPAWQKAMTLKKVTDTIVDFGNVKTETDFEFQGVFEPMPAREIYLKPEGQRNWKWWSLWTKTGIEINNGDIVVDFKSLRFRVMKKTDWAQAGYIKFDLVEDYKERP
ncbi:MAG: hypothetical protein KAV87_02190 [Desulfobacteraceae bacterium]|nr:hypothetical protein [Desulfobacteraceae bacterium]